MESISLVQQDFECQDNSSIVLNLNSQNHNIRIFLQKITGQFTDIIINPSVQEISINFHQSPTPANTKEQNCSVKEPIKKTFWELFDQYINKKSSEYSPGFIKQMKTTCNLLKRFAENRVINFEDIDIQFLEDFREYYIGKLGNKRNSFAGNIKRFKFFLQYALKNGWTNNEKFKQYKATERYGKVEYMTWEELMKLYKMDFKKANLNLVRDCFVFQSMIGCRHQDLKSLIKENFQDGILKFTTQKTGTMLEIPLTGISKDIIQNNAVKDPLSLLPVMNNGWFNKLLKQIGKLSGLVRKVEVLSKNGIKILLPFYKVMSSHMARRNFIGNAINNFNIRTEVIKSITGHSKNSNSFGRYYDIDMHTKKLAIEMMK